MKLASDWKKHLRYAWSVRFMALAVVFQCLDAAMPYLPALFGAYPGVMTALTVISVVGGLISKLIRQKEFDDAD